MFDRFYILASLTFLGGTDITRAFLKRFATTLIALTFFTTQVHDSNGSRFRLKPVKCSSTVLQGDQHYQHLSHSLCGLLEYGKVDAGYRDSLLFPGLYHGASLFAKHREQNLVTDQPCREFPYRDMAL